MSPIDTITLPPQQRWGVQADGVIEMTKPIPFADLPPPAPGQALVRILATSINFRDHLIIARDPAYPSNAKKGLVPTCDAAGFIVSLGDDTDTAGLKAGDNVTVHPNNWLTGGVHNFAIAETLAGDDRDGTLQKYAYLPVTHLLPYPWSLTSEQAAAVFTAGATAYTSLLYGLVSLRQSEDPLGFAAKMAGEDPTSLAGLQSRTVLVQGTGGVSVFAAQLAVAFGARVIGTTSSKEKVEFFNGIGVKDVVNYREKQDWDEEVLKLTKGKGADIVVEVGGAGTIEKSLAATKQGGVVTVMGILTESVKSDLVPAVLFGAKVVKGILGAGSLEVHRALLKAIDENGIKPVVGRAFDFEQAREAFAVARAGQAIGKVVIRC